MMREKNIYSVCGAGQWYADDPDVLRRDVRACFNCQLPDDLAFPLIGGIAPHAGYAYSGSVAGHTYAALRASAAKCGPPDVVVVLGFSHRPVGPGFALLDVSAIQTPLGQIPVEQEVTQLLLQMVPSARVDHAVHRGEHSAENHLPLLQYALPDVPVVVGCLCGHEVSDMQAVGQALTELAATRSVVCVASTDLLHDASYEAVCQSDASTLQKMESLDSRGLLKAWSPTHQVCCGIAPVTALLHYVAASGGKQGRVLFYQNSGDIDPASRGHWVVGYGALVFEHDGE